MFLLSSFPDFPRFWENPPFKSQNSTWVKNDPKFSFRIPIISRRFLGFFIPVLRPAWKIWINPRIPSSFSSSEIPSVQKNPGIWLKQLGLGDFLWNFSRIGISRASGSIGAGDWGFLCPSQEKKNSRKIPHSRPEGSPWIFPISWESPGCSQFDPFFFRSSWNSRFSWGRKIPSPWRAGNAQGMRSEIPGDGSDGQEFPFLQNFMAPGAGKRPLLSRSMKSRGSLPLFVLSGTSKDWDSSWD